MILKKRSILISVIMIGLISDTSLAAVDIEFGPVGTAIASGTIFSITGNSGATGVIDGNSWDVALALDSSSSMSGNKQQLQKDAAIAFVTSLPSTTSVSIIEYDDSASIVTGLTPVSSDLTIITNAINATDAGGGTDISTGINTAADELTTLKNGKLGDPDPARSQVMVVLSDGGSDSSQAHESALNSIAAGVDQVFSIGIGPSHDSEVMKNIVSGIDGIFATDDDIGVYTNGSDLSTLVNLFSGGGSLIGLDKLEITLPDGSILTSVNDDFSIGALGNFSFDYELQGGANNFIAEAFATDGSRAIANLTITTIVPLPGSVWLFGSAILFGVVTLKRKQKSNFITGLESTY